VLNAIRCMARSAGGWRMVPAHLGPRQTVDCWFRRLVRRLLFRTIHDVAPLLDRPAAGRAEARAGIWERIGRALRKTWPEAA
jgi:putative transposase